MSSVIEEISEVNSEETIEKINNGEINLKKELIDLMELLRKNSMDVYIEPHENGSYRLKINTPKFNNTFNDFYDNNLLSFFEKNNLIIVSIQKGTVKKIIRKYFKNILVTLAKNANSNKFSQK